MNDESKPQEHIVTYGPISPAPFEGDVDKMNRVLDRIEGEFTNIDLAADVYKKAAENIKAVLSVIAARAGRLADFWQGDDAEIAHKQLIRLAKTSENLLKLAQSAGVALEHYGSQMRWYVENRPHKAEIGLGDDYKDTPLLRFDEDAQWPGPWGEPVGVGGMTFKEADTHLARLTAQAVQDHMDGLSERAVRTNQVLPETIDTDMPDPAAFGSGQDAGGGGHRPAAGTGGAGHHARPAAFSGGVPSAPSDPFGAQTASAGLAGSPAGGLGGTPAGLGAPSAPGAQPFPPPGSDLAGLPGGSGGMGGGPGADPFGRAGLGGGAGAGAGGGAGGGLGGAGGGLPGGAGGLPGGLPGGAPRVPGGRGLAGLGKGPGPGAGAGAGAGTGARGGAGAMAGGGAHGGKGGGQGEEEHELSTWLTEDQSVWGADDGDAAPPVIG